MNSKPESKIQAALSINVQPALALAALGVVFGDIGTSPLYALKTCFDISNAPPSEENVLGIVSLIFWALAIVVCLKYIGTLMRIDNEGEGGILALLALSSPSGTYGVPVKPTWLTFLIIVGATMLFGDGIITPAISVVSAVEGTAVVTTAATPYVVPIAIAIVAGLFLAQSRGTERVGKIFGPVMIAWFVAIAATGIVGIVERPDILTAVNPYWALHFATTHGAAGFLVFGGVVLAITGVEALYADMSHFGRKPIAVAWYLLVFPALILNYMGQGASVLADPKNLTDPFFQITPSFLVIPLVILGTAATVIASQALISGAFTLTEQAINLNLWPRMRIIHTSENHRGQVYIPTVNATLAVGCVLLIATFKSSDNLAAAYGFAVSATMLATTIAFYHVATKILNWDLRPTLALALLFGATDIGFLLSTLPKVTHGAWLPISIAIALTATAWTWLVGRRRLATSLTELGVPMETYLDECRDDDANARGTMVFLTANPKSVPFLGASHEWIRRRAHEERVVVLSLIRDARPYIEENNRVDVSHFSGKACLVSARFGYMESPRIDAITYACGKMGINLESTNASYFYAGPKYVAGHDSTMNAWQRAYFGILARNSRPLPEDMGIPANRRIEVGVEVPI